VKLAAAAGVSSYPFLILYNWMFFAIYSANCVVSPLSPDTAMVSMLDILNNLFSSKKNKIKHNILRYRKLNRTKMDDNDCWTKETVVNKIGTVKKNSLLNLYHLWTAPVPTSQ